MATTGAREIVDKAGVIVFTVALSPNGKSITTHKVCTSRHRSVVETLGYVSFGQSHS